MKKRLVVYIVALLCICSGCGNAGGPQPQGKTSKADERSGKHAPAYAGPAMPTQGSIQVPVARLTEKTEELLVSCGVPFAPGQLLSDKNIIIFDEEGRQIPIATKILVRWVNDGSIRSALVQFNYSVPQKYRNVTLQWGQTRTAADPLLQKVSGDIPEGILLLPARWLCDSKIIGEQAPMEPNNTIDESVSKYDLAAVEYFKKIKDTYRSGDTREQGYYDTAHTWYQLYARTGNEEYFKFARKAAVGYREKEVLQEGSERGRNMKYKESRYIFVEAMADDYLFTGDEKSLEVAGYMAEYLKKNHPAEKAYLARGNEHFWTEREQAFPFLGLITYYELTGDQEYLAASAEYMDRLLRTQNEWPGRGGFIHNLYSHDPEEGCGKDEFGGSPFMAGLLLEAIVKYHWLTGSEAAEESIFKALDWLKKECLAPDGSSFVYLTCESKRDQGHPDLNLLIAHAFGYGYKISGYSKEEYLKLGKTVFDRGVEDAWLGDQKHFNQNYRSSGHFLAYIAHQKQADNTAQAVTAQNADKPKKESAVARPRLLMTAGDIPRLREKLGSPAFFKIRQDILGYAENNNDIVTCAFAYQLYKDQGKAARASAEKAIEAMRKKSIGSAQDLEDMALGYDWCYEAMDQDTVGSLARKIERAALEMSVKKKRALRSFHNEMYQLTTSVAAAGYALEGESELAQKFIAFAAGQYEDAIAMFNNVFIDGEWPESMDYNRHIAFPLVKYFEMVKSATGVNVYEKCDWLLKNAYFVIYTTQPDNTFCRFADNDYPQVNDWERRFLVRVASYYKDGYVQWYVNHATKPDDFVPRQIFDVLWYDRELAEKPVSELPKAKLFRGMGLLVARSGWLDTDTWFSFKSGSYFGDHVHLDNNSFTIYKEGNLAIDSGLYGNDFGGGHWCNYYSRTIAHNTVLLFDPGEKFYGYEGAPLANDGGQRIMLWEKDERVVPENYSQPDETMPWTWVQSKGRWDIARVAGYKSAPDYCYVSGDASSSYSAQKLKSFARDIVFIYPDYFIVFDRLEAVKPEFRKKWLIHSVNEPKISRNEITIVEGNGQLYGKALYPAQKSMVKVGGPGKEFLVGEKNHPHNNEIYPGNVPGAWRIEIEPTVPRKDDVFLNFMFATDFNNAQMPPVEKIESENALGASIKAKECTWMVIFSQESSRAKVNYTIRENGPVKNIILNLAQKSSYEVKVKGARVNTVVSDENGIIEFPLESGRESMVEVACAK